MFQNNVDSAQIAEEMIAQLTARLEAETKARQEAEVRAERAETQADLSIKKAVASEALAVSTSSQKREPKIMMLEDGTKRIDF